MDKKLRRLTPVVLLVLAGAVAFEPLLPAGLAGLFGAGTIMRVVVVVLCLYTLALILERERMAQDFKNVLGAFREFHKQQGQASSDGHVPESQKREAIEILISALESQDASVRDKAHQHLKRITGQQLPADPASWRAWLGKTSGR